MLQKIIELFSLICSFVLVSELIGEGAPIKITGEGQIVLINSETSAEDVFETANLTIIVDGPLYRISCDTVMGNVGKEEFGSDGIDSFSVNSLITPWNRDGKGLTGHASSGRFPQDCSPIIQAAWLGYCSKDYFDKTNHTIGLALRKVILSMSPPEYVTNLITYRAESTLPLTITGWGRNRIFYTGNPQVYDLDQYPRGYKAWEFAASDDVIIENERVPQRITLEGFLPKTENTNTMAGEEVRPVRKIIFIAHSIERMTNNFNPLPSLNVPDLTIIDSRFTNAGKYTVVSHADPTNGWPVRTSVNNPSIGYKNAEAEARQIALDNNLAGQTKSKNRKSVLGTILGINVLVFTAVWFSQKKQKQKENKI
jgi:hypothetical protein